MLLILFENVLYFSLKHKHECLVKCLTWWVYNKYLPSKLNFFDVTSEI